MEPKTKQTERTSIFFEIVPLSTLNSQFKSIENIAITPTTISRSETIIIEKSPDEMIFFASPLLFVLNAFTRLFLIPLPIPKSKFKNHIKTENNVYHTPRIILLLKYFIKAGVVRNDITRATPFIANAPIVFFKIILFLPSIVFSL